MAEKQSASGPGDAAGIEGLRVLMVEDCEDDALLVLRELRRGGLDAECVRVECNDDFAAALHDRTDWDVILCDYTLPKSDAPSVLAVLHRTGLDIPLIVVSGKIGEETAVDMMRAGAADYVMKDHLARLTPAVRRERLEASYRRAARAAEQALQREQAILGALVGSAMDAIITLGRDHRILVFNPAAEQMFGVPAAEVLGSTIDRFIPLASREVHIAHVERFATSGVTRRNMHPINPLNAVRANGEEFPVEATISQASVGDELFLTVIIRDISERKKLEAELLQSQKMEAIGKLAGGVAHDFNNLLTAILGYSELALMEADDPERLGIDIGEIKAAAERAAALTRQLLTLSRRSVAAPAAIDLNAVVTELERMLRRIIGKNYQVVSEAQEAVWPVKADRGQVEQVILNLVVNAQDAMPDGGTITVRTGNVTVRDGERGVEPGEYVVLSVSDHGIGMDDATRSRIFEPFFTTKGATHGTGLGLAIVQGVIEQSNGTVTVDSAPGQGTTFYVYFPRAREAGQPAAEHQPADIRGTETILLLKQDNAVRSLEQQLLEQYGYTVVPAGTVDEARSALAARGGIDLLVMNAMLIGYRGTGVLRELRALSPGLRALFLTGYTDEALLHDIEEVGHAHLLEKPFTSGGLARAVRRALTA
ncbi:MAG: response regulator [Dehalococcoidia bacterium]|nr:response regulator [Dehalococcoidia bacterium]